ncbi:hypothetical protein GSI_09463 [Ganoderma sinense ZZ0214-1]|uniref:Uncharacterized protein n=1 Tax=Ganoderma sinense ZZ0214-1 TaxID=1077348 RepID=A0A2G8S6M3_9APHY|nr:hypothetical protein GSI_09463 [Ganoderma sinense ZZ0214-1]
MVYCCTIVETRCASPPPTAPTSYCGASASSYCVRVKSEERDNSPELLTAHSSGGHTADEEDGADVIEALMSRIAELEDLCESQGEEIGELWAVVEAHMRNDAISRLPLTPLRETGSVSSADTFGRGKGKARVHREHPPSSPALRSVSSVSSVSSISTSPPPSSRAGTPSVSRTVSRADHVSRSTRMLVAGTPQTPRHRRTSGEGGIFHAGYYTDHAVAHYGLPLETFDTLLSVQRQYPSATWGLGILNNVQNLEPHEAEAITAAMRQDLGLVDVE